MRTDPLTTAVRLGIRRAFGETDRRCAQCWRRQPLAAFVGARGDLVRRCSDCRQRYANWQERSAEDRLQARRRVRRSGDGYTVRLVQRSMNRKTGPIPVSTTDMKSCPTSCPLMDRGCYAGYGKAAGLWRGVATTGLAWDDFCSAVASLEPGTLWRHNEAGDLPGVGDDLDVRALDELVEANVGRRGFTFTHKPLVTWRELEAVRRANDRGFAINLSADGLADADRLLELGVGPVAAVVASVSSGDVERVTPKGRPVVVCPAVTSGLTCATCGLCSKQRAAVVAFPAHGQAAALVSLRLGRLRP